MISALISHLNTFHPRQSLRKIPSCQFVYGGPKCGGVGGWADDDYICINPYHYGMLTHFCMSLKGDSYLCPAELMNFMRKGRMSDAGQHPSPAGYSQQQQRVFTSLPITPAATAASMAMMTSHVASGIDPRSVAVLRKIGTAVKMPANETIAVAGQPSSQLIVILSGSVRLVHP